MGAPVETGLENFEEAILKLSVADRVKLIHWISETVVESAELLNESESHLDMADKAWPPENVPFAEDLSGKTPWYGDFNPEQNRARKKESCR